MGSVTNTLTNTRHTVFQTLAHTVLQTLAHTVLQTLCYKHCYKHCTMETGHNNLTREEIQAFIRFAREKVISHQAFKLFDGDGNGLVTIEELRQLFEKVGGKLE